MDRNCYNGIDIVLTPSSITYTSKHGVKEKALNLDINKIHEQLESIGYTCPYTSVDKWDYYDEALENYGIPFMNFVYYYELYKLQRIPTFEEFYKGYLNIYCDPIGNGKYKIKPFFDGDSNFSFTEKQLMGRVFRSYNSFHREVELLYQLAAYDGVHIKYCFQDDMNGVDFTLTYKGHTFCLASYVGTRRSYGYKNIKNNDRHSDYYSQRHMIDIVAKWGKGDGTDNCDCINGIYLYSPAFVASTFFEIVKEAEEGAVASA